MALRIYTEMSASSKNSADGKNLASNENSADGKNLAPVRIYLILFYIERDLHSRMEIEKERSTGVLYIA